MAVRQECNSLTKRNLLYGEKWGIDVTNFIQISRLWVKIDNLAVQDGYSFYHHTFIFTKEGDWAVIQQGMNEEKKDALYTSGFQEKTLI